MLRVSVRPTQRLDRYRRDKIQPTERYQNQKSGITDILIISTLLNAIALFHKSFPSLPSHHVITLNHQNAPPWRRFRHGRHTHRPRHRFPFHVQSRTRRR